MSGHDRGVGPVSDGPVPAGRTDERGTFDRYGRDPEGEWAVLDFDGNPLPGRWATEDAAYEGGMAGVYLFSGYDVARLSGSEGQQ